MIDLSWRQVLAWRLQQHCLSPRLPKEDFLHALSRTGGLQAQVMSAAGLGLYARVDGLTRETIPQALWQERTMLKTWAMRGTLHLLNAADLPLYVAARSWKITQPWVHYFEYFGFTQAQMEAFLQAIPQVLGAEPLSREELAQAVADHTGTPGFRELIIESNWGSPLKPSAFMGDLCCGPSRGGKVTFVNPAHWLPAWKIPDPQEAALEVARRYLRAFGPANAEYFAKWWGAALGFRAARRIFSALGPELESVNIEGTPALALRSMLEPLGNTQPGSSVRLLPLFDAYPLGHGRENAAVLPPPYKFRVYRPQGWISAVVLVDGVIQGVWELKTRASRSLLKISLFELPASALQDGLESEISRLENYLNARIETSFE